MLQVLYTRCFWGEIVLCEAPVGTSLFWPAEDSLTCLDGELRGRWKLGQPVKDTLEPRTRIVPFAQEIPVTKLSAAIRSAFSKLAPKRQKSGYLGVILKGEKYKAVERGRQYVFERPAFFHMFKDESPRWKDLPSIFERRGPKGCPTKLEHVR